MRAAEDYMHHLYIHMNDVDHFVIFSGLKLKQFLSSVEPLRNLLLLKHTYEDGSFNMHTQFDFISTEDMPSFKKIDVKGDLCWVDFTHEKQLNQLTPMEQAELLYLGHKHEPLSSPFFDKLQNRYVYYVSPNDKMTKVYFRYLADTEQLMSNVFNAMIKEREGNGGFWRRKSKKSVPMIDTAVLRACRSFLKEGALLSLYKLDKPNSTYGIEIRALVEYDFPDEVWDDLNELLKRGYDEFILIN